MTFSIIMEARAQSRDSVMDMLDSRTASDDNRLQQELWKSQKALAATKEQVMKVMARAFDYYEQRNYFPAESLFASAIVTYRYMQWEHDAAYARAKYYSAKSGKAFCEMEPTYCRIYNADDLGSREFPMAAAWNLITSSFADIFQLKNLLQHLPDDLKADAKRECLNAQSRYRKEVQLAPGYLKARNVRPPEFYKCQ